MKEAQEITFGVDGMACGGCAAGLERSLREQEGVREARVDFAGRQARICFDPARVQPEGLAAAIRGAGYDVRS